MVVKKRAFGKRLLPKVEKLATNRLKVCEADPISKNQLNAVL